MEGEERWTRQRTLEELTLGRGSGGQAAVGRMSPPTIQVLALHETRSKDEHEIMKI